MLENASINIDKKYYDTYKKLCKSEKLLEKDDQSDSLFSTMWELFVWCAVLGFLNDLSVKVKELYSPFRWHNISNKHQELLLIFTLSKQQDFGVIKDKKYIQETIENYANGGMQLVQEHMVKDNKAYTNLENLIFTIIDRYANNL